MPLCHCATIQLGHFASELPCHHSTLTLCHSTAMSQRHYVPLSYHATTLRFEPLPFSHGQSTIKPGQMLFTLVSWNFWWRHNSRFHCPESCSSGDRASGSGTRTASLAPRGQGERHDSRREVGLELELVEELARVWLLQPVLADWRWTDGIKALVLCLFCYLLIYYLVPKSISSVICL